MKATALVAGVIVGFCSFARCVAEQKQEQPAVTQQDRDEYLQLYGVLAEAVAQIEINSAAPVERERLFAAALHGMMAELDAYSDYLPPEQFRKLKQLAKQARPEVGLELAIEEGRLSVLGVRAGSAAEQAGIAPGERLLAIDGQDAQGMPLGEAERRLASGSGVELLLESADGERVITLQPASSAAATVTGVRLLERGVGYARINRFGGDTAAELRSAMDQLLKQGAGALVLDLRYNAGGLLQAAVDSADLLLDRGTIVSVVARRGEPRVWQAGEGDAMQGKPVAVLVNRYSASGSEVLAAALQDNRRAAVVGERTWGKGSVQSVIPLGDGKSALKLTTARYVRPSGKSIHRFPQSSGADQWGVTPSEGLEASLTAEQDRALLKFWRSGEEPSEPDAQLQLAVEAVTGGERP